MPLYPRGHNRLFDRRAGHDRRDPRRPTPASTPGDGKPAAPGQTRRVLIVEDEPNVRLVFRTALASNDLMIATAADGETALNWQEREPFDLVLLDLQMHGVGGMEVLHRLRTAGDNVPVVVITAHDSVPNAVQAMKLGAIDFLAKPLAPAALRRMVAEVLARHPRDGNGPEPVSSPARTPTRNMLSSAKRALNHRLFPRAERLLREAIKDDPESAEPWYLLGVLHEVQNKPRAAQDAYRTALRINPGYKSAKYHLMKFDTGR